MYIHDHMTGLLNRRGFYRLLQKLIDSSGNDSTSIVIISADLDGLKYINDTFGHFEGDNAISEAARALLANTSNMDICARFGGDEFVVAALVPEGTEKQYFLKFKNGFLKKLAEYNSSSGKAYQIGSSIGFFAEKLTAAFDMEKMLQLADKQMYADKAARKKERNN
ncbi:MAG TPA: GGDEF domain-containing protein [Ruminococcus flavefaciens]|nr:GGDEF domain-containing protein [Ruminococcus flavefaciens]